MSNPFPTEPVVAEVRQVETAESLKNVSLRALEKIKELKEKKKLLAERKKAMFENDSNVAEAEREAEEYIEAVKTAKERVKATNSYAELEAELKDLNGELKEYGETVNGHLFEYSRITGKNEITDQDGKTLKIKHQVQVKSGQLRLF